jgi:uncharacterized membrane protein YfcA
MHEAAGTSLVVAVGLTMPTIAPHAALGGIDWPIAGLFTLGVVPGVLAGSRIAHRLPTARLRTGFGMVLVAFALWFLARQTGLTA